MPYPTEQKARIIVEASLTTDRKAADNHDCSRRSIQNWRDELDTNTELQERVTELWQEVREADDWVEDATDTIRTALSFLRTAFDELDPSDPEAVEAVTEATRTLSEAKLTADVIEQRLEGLAGPDAQHRRN
jgi:cell division septum initiation protein DivIVA